jgi:hypothetical protein
MAILSAHGRRNKNTRRVRKAVELVGWPASKARAPLKHSAAETERATSSCLLVCRCLLGYPYPQASAYCWSFSALFLSSAKTASRVHTAFNPTKDRYRREDWLFLPVLVVASAWPISIFLATAFTLPTCLSTRTFERAASSHIPTAIAPRVASSSLCALCACVCVCAYACEG